MCVGCVCVRMCVCVTVFACVYMLCAHVRVPECVHTTCKQYNFTRDRVTVVLNLQNCYRAKPFKGPILDVVNAILVQKPTLEVRARNYLHKDIISSCSSSSIWGHTPDPSVCACMPTCCIQCVTYAVFPLYGGARVHVHMWPCVRYSQSV